MYIRFITIINGYLHQHNERLLIIFAWSFVKIFNNRAQSSKIKLHKEAYRRNLYTIQKEKERNKDSRLTGFPTTKRNHLDRKSYLFEREKRTVRGDLFARDFDTFAGRRVSGEWWGSLDLTSIIRYDTVQKSFILRVRLCIYTYFVATRKSRTRGNNFKIIGSISRNEQFIYI